MTEIGIGAHKAVGLADIDLLGRFVRLIRVATLGR